MKYQFELEYFRHFIDGHLKGIKIKTFEKFQKRGDVEAFLVCMRDARVNEIIVDKDHYNIKKTCTYKLQNFILIDLRVNLPVSL